ncbi:MAG: GNAT family N-acetyltransferase [Clostridiales bacterium]|nr:GNAT family N-acetyltransferase [Clostridiales bacterium]
MKDAIIRCCKKEDEAGIVNVCYHSGYMGEDLDNKNIFNDVKLFGYLFCVYYVRYQTEHCFVAEDVKTKQIVGYILGALNTKKQKIDFYLKMSSKILSHVTTCTILKYPETLKSIMFFLIYGRPEKLPKNLFSEYPAHLHINILSEYQRYGIGAKLMEKFENHVRLNRVKGIHLQTTSENIKAISFYNKLGYQLISEHRIHLWRDIKHLRSLLLVKKMDNIYS